jgi:hypothetical protein
MTHQCHVPGCKVVTQPKLLTCPAHWKLVPPELQREVYATVGKRGKLIDATWAPWWRAQARAIHAIMQAEKRDPVGLEKWLAHELKVADQMEARS